MGLVLDLSVLIGAERGRFDLTACFQAYAEEPFFIAAITASELLHGVERASSPERRDKRSQFVEGVLDQLPVIDFDQTAARKHALVWAELERKGMIIGPHDLLIAATALTWEHAVLTLNTSEFSRVPDLDLADVAPFLRERS